MAAYVDTFATVGLVPEAGVVPFPTAALAHAKGIKPVVISKEAARLPCGCSIFVGIRLDNHEQATSSGACSEAHSELINRATVMLLDSLEHPQAGRQTVEVCVELLDAAAEEVGVDA